MSNIAGKTSAMNVVTPVKWYWRYVNQLLFWAVGSIFKKNLIGLQTLSLIHYARWVIIKNTQFPHLDSTQPKEELKYSYMIFESNFNGSWDQYVDSFFRAIPKGLDLLWYKNVNHPRSSPLTPFHRYINHNQIFTDYYYSAYPIAASNDVKEAKKVKDTLLEMQEKCDSLSPEQFEKFYHKKLLHLQNSLSEMHVSPIVSLAAQEVSHRRLEEQEALRGKNNAV